MGDSRCDHLERAAGRLFDEDEEVCEMHSPGLPDV